jgi:hypothetical protein
MESFELPAGKLASCVHSTKDLVGRYRQSITSIQYHLKVCASGSLKLVGPGAKVFQNEVTRKFIGPHAVETQPVEGYDSSPTVMLPYDHNS